MESDVTVREDSGEAVPQALSFSALEEQISIYLPDNSNPTTDRQGLISAAGLIGTYLAIKCLNIFFPTAKIPAWAVFILISTAVISTLWLLYATIRREIPEIRDRRRISAAELDEQSAGYKKLVAWLQSFPATSLEERLDFVQRKLETIEQRSGALFGNIERFGFLTVLVALYLQFKGTTISWPPDVSLSSLFLTSAILGVYFASVWATSYKWQLNTYRQLLQIATKSAP